MVKKPDTTDKPQPVDNRPSILLVDDDTVSLDLLCKLIERLNYKAIRATDGDQALKVLAAQPVDLVISDYEMPTINGLDLLREVKNQYPRLPYILVTAYSNLRVIREAWENGAFDFFQKPVFVDRLNQTVRLAIEYGHISIARRRFPKIEKLQPDPDLLNAGVIRELAVALERKDLLAIIEEYETHAHIELEKLLRFSMGQDSSQVRMIAHRLRGTSLNLGLVRMNEEMAAIEAAPEAPIRRPMELEQTLNLSIQSLKHYLSQVFQDLAG
jgi:CheY-like chemotaxis protein